MTKFQRLPVCPPGEASKKLNIGIIYDVVDLRTGECVKAGSTEKSLLQRWNGTLYRGGKGKFDGYGLIEVFRIEQHVDEPDDLFTWRLRVKEQQHILACGYLDSRHPLHNLHLPLSGIPDASTIGRIGGRMNVQSGHLARIRTPEHQRKAGLISGRKHVESGHIVALGHSQGRTNVENGHLQKLRRKNLRLMKKTQTGIFAPGMQSIAARLGGVANKQRGTGLCDPTIRAMGAPLGGRVAGRAAVETGRLAIARITANHVRHHEGDWATCDDCQRIARHRRENHLQRTNQCRICKTGKYVAA